MVVHREIIQALRAKRSAQAVDELLAQGQSQLMVLLAQSGLLEKGVDPRSLNLSPEQRDALIQAAQALQAQGLIDGAQGGIDEAQGRIDAAQGLMDEAQARKTDRGRTPV